MLPEHSCPPRGRLMGDSGKISKNNLTDVWPFCVLFLWKTCLNNRFKSPGNQSDQFWSNQISVSLCEEPKPNMSMIPGFLDLWDPLFIDLNIRKILHDIWENIGKHWKNLRSVLPKCCQYLKRWASKNGEDPSNNISKAMDTGPISIKKHEWMFANMVSIPIAKHTKDFGISNVGNLRIISLGPKQSFFSQGFPTQRNFTMAESGYFVAIWKS